jgi:proteasome lid subunit RPN8/RPN11
VSDPASAPDRDPGVHLLVDRPVYESVLQHAREGLTDPDGPVEVCGVLGGRRAGSGSGSGSGSGAESSHPPPGPTPTRVTESRRVRNVAARARTRYELDPAQTVAAIDGIEAAGRDHVGFYHSHPDGPLAPSATDRAAAQWPDRGYVIVDPRAVDGGEDGETSTGDDPPGLGAWRWTGESFEPLSVRVVDD